MKKIDFLRERFPAYLEALDPNTPAIFGKMNVHQMIEHMSHAFQIASGKVYFENKQSDEVTEKMYHFMMSDKPFRDNTPNPNLSDTPLPTRFNKVRGSLDNLEEEIEHFFSLFESEEGLQIESPFFGNLNFEEQVHLLHKHAVHHLRQFGITL